MTELQKQWLFLLVSFLLLATHMIPDYLSQISSEMERSKFPLWQRILATIPFFVIYLIICHATKEILNAW